MVRYFWLDGRVDPQDWPFALASLKKLAKSPDVPPGELYNLCLYLYQGAGRLGTGLA